MNDTTNTEVLVPVTVSPELDEAIKKEIAEGTPVVATEEPWQAYSDAT